MKVIVRGRVSVYERDGVYQIYAEDMQPDGAGALAIAYEQLKSRLSKEGIFDEAHKKQLPAYPKRIGVVTSPTGAAVQDILNIIGRRWPIAEVILCPVSVQGDLAAWEISTAITELDSRNACDVIIFGRGGGSVEDLWSFNNEQLVRTVFSCNTPIISAVGHETDFTLCDFAADMRAPTPSAAAELATPDILQEKRRLESLTDALFSLTEAKVDNERLRYDNLIRRRSFASPSQFFAHEKQYADSLASRLVNAQHAYLFSQRSKFAANAAKLDALSPLKVLGRGYAAVYINKKIISSVCEISEGDKISVSMSDGTLHCTVDSLIE